MRPTVVYYVLGAIVMEEIMEYNIARDLKLKT